ncbi:hypothetical protein ACMFMG_007940 [Clarireedia jacksonii]
MDTSSLASSATLVINAPSDGPFARAVHEVVGELKLKPREPEKNPFLKELINISHPQASASSRSNPLQSDESANTLRESIRELESRRTGGRGYKILHRLSPFIENLQSLMKICEAVVQDAPFGVSIAFSGARVVLDLAFKVHSQFETILEAIEEIGTILKCYKLLAKYDNTPSFQDLLVRSYKNIIQFWLKASQTLSQNLLKTMMKSIITKPLHTVIKDAQDKLRQDGCLLDRYASAIGLSHATVDREERRKERSEDLRKESCQNHNILRNEISGWIRGHENLDANIDFEEQLSRRQKGTCDWILKDQSFKDWCDGTNGAILWYNSPPGSGKSVLASSVINDLKKSNEKVAMFFYSFSNVSRRNGISGIRSLALQALGMTQTLPDKLIQRYEEQKHYSDFLQSYPVASDFLHQLLSPLDRIYLVIDGLDECSDDAIMLPVLCNLVQAKVYATVKWLFLSRDHTQIREAMAKVNAVELCPEPNVISASIKTYVASTLTCINCFNEWSDECEQNFLYARFVCEKLRRVGLTCDADVDRALKRFPKTLNSYYIRSLEEFEKYSTEEQELVRRVFVILVGAEQSISFQELIDAASIELGANDYDDSRLPQKDLIEKLCGPMLTVERRGKVPQDNPTIKFYHKTVKDFLLQNPDALDSISPGARKYFVTSESAHREMGLLCLTYLKYDRYTKCQDIKGLLDKNAKEHAFLRYAATFWCQHLCEVKHTPDLTEQVTGFLKSKAFWTCLGVQSHVARYLFGSFTGTKSGYYRMDFKRIKGNGSHHFGIPLPDWLSGVSTECRLMDQSLCCFANEWSEVITNHSEGLNLCSPLRHFAESCHLNPLIKSKKLRVENLAHLSDMDAVAGVRLLDVSFSGKRLLVDVLVREKDDAQDKLYRLREAVLPSKDSHSSRQHLPLGGDMSGWDIFPVDDNVIEAWSVYPQSLKVRRTTAERSDCFELPHSVAKCINEERNGEWKVLRATTEFNDAKKIRTRILHAGWQMKKFTIPLPSQQDENEDSDNDSASSGFESEEENDSDDQSLSGSSNCQYENGTSDTDYDAEDGEKKIRNCLILVQPECPPYWTRPWSSSLTRWEKVGSTMHPTLPILAFTHTSLQIELVDLETMTQSSKHLPEPVDFHGKPAASTRELRFSPRGDYLHCLSISLTEEPTSTKCDVTVAAYRFNPDGNSDDTFIRESQPIQCTYSFSDRLTNIPLPLTLTYWNDDALLIALPPLTCDPKIILVKLSKNGGDEDTTVKTLRTPIYFPASTPHREPRMLHRSGSDGKNSYLYLALGAVCPSTDPDSTERPSKDDPDARHPETQASPPAFLQWKIPQKDGWRALDANLDSKSSDLRREISPWKVLRGDFVESEKPFSVPIRSGLNWDRKAYLSCR